MHTYIKWSQNTNKFQRKTTFLHTNRYNVHTVQSPVHVINTPNTDSNWLGVATPLDVIDPVNGICILGKASQTVNGVSRNSNNSSSEQFLHGKSDSMVQHCQKPHQTCLLVCCMLQMYFLVIIIPNSDTMTNEMRKYIYV